MIKRVFILFVIFSLCFCSIAFADDLEPDTAGSSPSADDRLATDEEIQALDSAILETSHNLALLMASGDSVKATDYEQATYNLLSSVFGSSTSSWASIVATRLGYLSTINSSANSLVVKLTGFYNSINPDYDTTGISMYDVAHGILTALTSVDPNDGDLTIIETLVYITSALDDLHTDLSAILNSTYSIDNKLVNINTAITQFKSDLLSSISTLDTDINTGFSNVNANMATIISRLQSMQNEYSNINWIGLTLSNTLVYDSIVTDISGLNNISISTLYDTVYYYFTVPNNTNFSKYFMFTAQLLTITKDVDFNVKFYIKTSSGYYTEIPSYTFKFYTYPFGSTKFISYLDYHPNYANINNTSNLMISISANGTNNKIYLYSTNMSASYVDYNSIDFYTLNTYDILNRFKSLYASDDFIESKEAQQPLEDQIISDFTGNGSASATVGDAVNVKQASNAIKNGLNTGANSGVALDYAFGFNNPSGLFVWFSSDTAQYFTLYQPTRGIPDYSDIEWTDELPDHLSIIDYKYLQRLDND